MCGKVAHAQLALTSDRCKKYGNWDHFSYTTDVFLIEQWRSMEQTNELIHIMYKYRQSIVGFRFTFVYLYTENFFQTSIPINTEGRKEVPLIKYSFRVKVHKNVHKYVDTGSA